MRLIWLLLLAPLTATAADWNHELLLAGAGDSLEVTLVSHAPLPLDAARVRQWLALPDAAACHLLRAPRDVPANEADRPKTRYVWQFQCAHLAQLTQLGFNNTDGTSGRLYLQWVLPAGQGKALLDEPLAGFDFSAASQAGGTL